MEGVVSARSCLFAAVVTIAATAAIMLRGPLVAWFTIEPPPAHASVDHYTCSMHPSVNEANPGTCPICGMNLIPVTGEPHDRKREGVVSIDAARRQLIGVRTEPVVEGPMRNTFRAVGHVAYDESTFAGVHVNALKRVRVEADVYESDLAHVRVGQPARVTLDYLPGRVYEAKVAYVYPYVDAATRSGRVRLQLANGDLGLRPGMYARVELSADLGSRVQVPTSAVVYTGPRRLAFVDLGEGRFRPTEVQLGAESNGVYEVVSGLAPGDVVATSGIFLIAAEARITTAATYWSAANEADAGSPPPGQP
jgi:membrane fusion protein, copper/silver efflux system